MLPISIKDLQICFDSINFSLRSHDADMVTISHPRYRDDGHRKGVTFRKVMMPSGKTTWELASSVKVVSDYGP